MSPKQRAAGGSNTLVRGDKAKYYILIDLIFGSQRHWQRYLTRITRGLSGDSNAGKVPFARQNYSRSWTALASGLAEQKSPHNGFKDERKGKKKTQGQREYVRCKPTWARKRVWAQTQHMHNAAPSRVGPARIYQGAENTGQRHVRKSISMTAAFILLVWGPFLIWVQSLWMLKEKKNYNIKKREEGKRDMKQISLKYRSRYKIPWVEQANRRDKKQRHSETRWLLIIFFLDILCLSRWLQDLWRCRIMSGSVKISLYSMRGSGEKNIRSDKWFMEPFLLLICK